MRWSTLTVMAAALLAACSQADRATERGAIQPRRRQLRLLLQSSGKRRPRAPPTIDPKSNAAAEELVRGFVRLINSGRLDDAYMLLGPNAPPRSDFDRQFAGYSHLRANVGAAGDQEGAAGSIYVTVPLTISAESGGKHVERSADAVLRRVNDVPGSTEAQRHWHIERIDWK